MKKNQNKKNKNKNKPKRIVRNMRPLRIGRRKVLSLNALTLSECAAKYALAAVEPFNPLARGACVPLPPAVGSQKLMQFARFAVTIPAGATYGAVWFTPTLANDTACAWYTSGEADGYYSGQKNFLTLSNVNASHLTKVKFANCPYSATDLHDSNPAVAGRIVSYGASITCTSPSLYLGGTLVSYSSPTHEYVSQLYGYDDLLGQALAVQQPLDKRVHWIACHGIDDRESMYSNDKPSEERWFPFSNDQYTNIGMEAFESSGEGAPIMCFLINVPSNANSAQTFNVQVIQHSEYTGARTSALQTPTHVDVTGASQVRTALSQIHEIRAQNPNVNVTSAFKQKLQKVMVDNMKRVAVAGLTTLATEYGGPTAGATVATIFNK